MGDNSAQNQNENSKDTDDDGNFDSQDDFNLYMKAVDYSIFQNDDSWESLRRAFHKHPEWEEWVNTVIKPLLFTYKDDEEKFTETMRMVYSPFILTFEDIFEILEKDDLNNFDEVRERLVAEDIEMFSDVYNKLERIGNGEEPSDVFDSKEAAIRFNTVIKDGEF